MSPLLTRSAPLRRRITIRSLGLSRSKILMVPRVTTASWSKAKMKRANSCHNMRMWQTDFLRLKKWMKNRRFTTVLRSSKCEVHPRKIMKRSLATTKGALRIASHAGMIAPSSPWWWAKFPCSKATLIRWQSTSKKLSIRWYWRCRTSQRWMKSKRATLKSTSTLRASNLCRHK